MRFSLVTSFTGFFIALAAGITIAQPYQPTDRTLLLDHLDEDFTPDGKLCTKPAVMKAAADFTGGRPGLGGQFVEGKFGNGACRFTVGRRCIIPPRGTFTAARCEETRGKSMILLPAGR